MSRRIRLAVFASHPIQYQAPIWRGLARRAEVDLLVHYFSDTSVRGGVDPGFGVPVAWDQPLLEGYQTVFLSRGANLDRPLTVTIPHFEDYLRERRFDAVFFHGYEYAFELQLRRFAKSLRLPLIMRPELSTIATTGRLRRSARSLYRRWFYAGVSAFAVIGEQARRSLSEDGVPSHKMFFSPYAVDSELFEANSGILDRDACRRRLGIPSDRFMLLFSGKLLPQKNASLVLRALERWPVPARIVFVVVGDGPERSRLEREGKRLLGGDFLLAGFKNQSELAPYFKAADALVLPSLHETWGLVVNEAMHFGLPVIVSDRVCCLADLLENRETGLVFRSDDAGDLARALHQIMENDHLRQQFSRNVRRVIQEYTPDRAANGILNAVEKALEITSPAG